MYAKYSNCDPFMTAAIKRKDELLPYYVMDVAGGIPGLPGLFIAGIVCAALRFSLIFKSVFANSKCRVFPGD